MTTRAEKLVALAKMRQDWRNVNDCINDDLIENRVNVNIRLHILNSTCYQRYLTCYERKKHSYECKLYAEVMAWSKLYAEVMAWSKQTLLELSWLEEEIIRLEKELYYK